MLNWADTSKLHKHNNYDIINRYLIIYKSHTILAHHHLFYNQASGGPSPHLHVPKVGRKKEGVVTYQCKPKCPFVETAKSSFRVQMFREIR